MAFALRSAAGTGPRRVGRGRTCLLRAAHGDGAAGVRGVVTSYRDASSPIPKPRIALGVLAGVIVLVIGIWLGGHPAGCPRGCAARSWTTTAIRSSTRSSACSSATTTGRSTAASSSTRDWPAAVASLDDPYSHYYDPTDYQGVPQPGQPAPQRDRDRRPGTSPGACWSIDVFPGSPAAKAGLLRGDVIVAVGATSLASRPANFGSQLIKGRAGTRVTLTILRGSKQRHTVTLLRADIVVPVAAGQIVNYHGVKIGALQLTQLHRRVGRRAAKRRSRRCFTRARAALILDLRDNAGGLLNEAVNVASIFIPDGTIVSTDGRSQPRQVYVAKGGAIATEHPDGRARRPRHRVGGRDRHRRAPGPRPRQGRRHAHLRQGRVPGDRAAPQRRRARHHRRRVLHAERDATSAAAACKRGRRDQARRLRLDNPGSETDTALKVAERTVAAEVQ